MTAPAQLDANVAPTARLWNDGKPVWNKGKRTAKPVCATCPWCSATFAVTERSKRWRARRGQPVYCSIECKRLGSAGKISAAMMGHPGYLPSPEGFARRNAANTGRIPWNKGQSPSPEFSAKRGAAIKASPKAKAHRDRMHATFKGPNSPHWKGGITPANVMARNSLEAKAWRAAVLERDDYTCQHCSQRGGNMHAHHVESFAARPDLRWELSNGETLCIKCHRKTPNYGRARKQA